jgi:A/G-specific adenine glycosylase
MKRPTVTKESQQLQELVEALRIKKGRIQEGVFSWASSNITRSPWRRMGSTPYEVVIGEILLGKTTYAVANRVYRRFVQCFPTSSALAEASEDELAKFIGYYYPKRHIAYVKAVIEGLLKEGIEKVPKDSYALRSLGLEHHSISCIMCFGYGVHLAVIDSNVSRMLSRVFRNNLPAKPSIGLIQAIGETLLPEFNPAQYNASLLDLAEQICRIARPLCVQCSVRDVCDYESANVDIPSIYAKC